MWPIEEAKKDIAEGKGIFVDVREDFEVSQGHAQGTLWIPLGEITSNFAAVAKKLKDEHGDIKFYIYCRSGNRSGMASQILGAQGLNCINAGGLADLAEKEVTIVSGLPK
jgi:phage shock protein E